MALGGSFILASALEGQVVDTAGAPAADLALERRWSWPWTGETGAQTARTDAEGRFAFPEVTGRSLTAGWVPHEPNVRAELVAEGPEGPVMLLAIAKSSYAAGSEALKVGLSPPLRVRCRIDAEPSADGLYWGTCEAME